MQLICLFRGRELAHKDVAHKVLFGVFERLDDIAKVEVPPHMEGRRMVMLISKK